MLSVELINMILAPQNYTTDVLVFVIDIFVAADVYAGAIFMIIRIRGYITYDEFSVLTRIFFFSMKN